MEIKGDLYNFIAFSLISRGIVDILLCAMVIVGYYRRDADLFLPYLVINVCLKFKLHFLIKNIKIRLLVLFYWRFIVSILPLV